MRIEELIQTFGLPGIALGTALEGEAVAFLGGILAHRRLFPFEVVALAATAGAALIDNLTFQVGRHASRTRIVARLLSRGAVNRFREFLGRHPVEAILALRFLYGMKTAGALLLGTTSVRWSRFAFLDLLGCAAWAHLIAGLGFVAGTAIEAAFGRLGFHHHLVVALLLFLAAAGLLWYFRRRRRTNWSDKE